MEAREMSCNVLYEDDDDVDACLTRSGNLIANEAMMTSRAFLRVSLSLHATRMAAKATCCPVVPELAPICTAHFCQTTKAVSMVRNGKPSRPPTAVINPHACDRRDSKVMRAAGLLDSDRTSESKRSWVAGVR